MRNRQRRFIISFDELDECALKPAFLEHAKSAARRSVMTVRCTNPLEILLAFGSGNGGPLNCKYARHQTALS